MFSTEIYPCITLLITQSNSNTKYPQENCISYCRKAVSWYLSFLYLVTVYCRSISRETFTSFLKEMHLKLRGFWNGKYLNKTHISKFDNSWRALLPLPIWSVQSPLNFFHLLILKLSSNWSSYLLCNVSEFTLKLIPHRGYFKQWQKCKEFHLCEYAAAIRQLLITFHD